VVTRPGLNKDIIAKAAAELVDQVGIDRLTFAAVAERLGVRTPSLYNHLDGLDALRRELALLGLSGLDRHLQRAALGKSGDAALTAMLQAYRVFAKEHPGVYEMTLKAPNPGDAEIQAAAEGIIDTLLTVLMPYHLDHAAAIHVVRGFRAIGHGFASLESAGGFGMDIDIDESYARLIDAFLSGLKGIHAAVPDEG
jgi:AcrR family transcriptional regulator